MAQAGELNGQKYFCHECNSEVIPVQVKEHFLF